MPVVSFVDQRAGNSQLVELLGRSVCLGCRIDERFEQEVAIKWLPFNRAQQVLVERLVA